MILLSEYSKRIKQSAGTDYLKRMEETARLLGISVINFEQFNFDSLQENLNRKTYKEKEIVFWSGFVPRFSEYELAYNILQNHGLRLINSSEEFAKSEYFNQFYPIIKNYSIESGITDRLEDAKDIANQLNYPVFLKGSIQSLKKMGWKNCVANNGEELEEIFKKLKANIDFSLGKIIIRKYEKLNYKEIGGNGIPKAHEYRFLVLNKQIIDYSYYWNGENPFELTPQKLHELKHLAIEIGEKVNVPYISIDIAETTDKQWKVIEIGDGQFSDIRNISALKLWTKISNMVQ